MKIVADRNIPCVEACFSHLGQVKVVDGRHLTRNAVADADVILVRSVTKVDESLLRDSHVRFVATATIGFEHVDRNYLNANCIGFASAPGSNANSVAEYIVAALLEIGKKKSIELTGASIGIVGVGQVGSRVAAKCEALGMQVVCNDPPLARQTGDPVYRPLEEIFACDFVTLHTPLTREGRDKTYHLAGEHFFNSLKQEAVFINTARGSVMDTQALKKAMNTGRLKAVCLDVWENEPCIDLELLRKVDIATPHIAGYSFDGKIAGLIMIYEAVCRHFDIDMQHTVLDFLPESAVPQIKVDTLPNEQDTIRRVVQQIYTIEGDHAHTRKLLQKPKPDQGTFFDGLRKNYPRRREFQNTTVRLDIPSDSLGTKLTGVGFKVAKEGQ